MCSSDEAGVLRLKYFHSLAFRSPKLSEEDLAAVVAESSKRFINENKPRVGGLPGDNWQQHSRYQNRMRWSLSRSISFGLNMDSIGRRTVTVRDVQRNTSRS